MLIKKHFKNQKIIFSNLSNIKVKIKNKGKIKIKSTVNLNIKLKKSNKKTFFMRKQKKLNNQNLQFLKMTKIKLILIF